MAQIKRRNPTAQRRVGTADMSEVLARVPERISLPDVPMRFDYQSDVDTLCVLFDDEVSSSLVSEDDEQENGVIGIYDGRKLVGVEILDITGRLAQANPV
jgi:hypothetical protein